MSVLIGRYSTNNYDYNASLVSGSNTSIGQTFIPTCSVTLNSVKFYLYQISSPTGTVYAKLYAHSGTFGSTGVPTGSALATASVAATSLPTSIGLVEFTFSSPYTVTAGTPYCIVVEYTSGVVPNYIGIGIDSSTPAHPGNSVWYTSSWTYNVSYDVIFYAYTTQDVVSVLGVGTPVSGKGSSLTPTIPADTQDGDLMMAVFGHLYTTTLDTLTGWSNEVLLNPNFAITVSYRVKQSGDSDPTFTFSGYIGETVTMFIVSFYNVNTSDKYDVSAATGSFSAPGSPYDITIPGFSTNTNGALALFFVQTADDNTLVYQSGGGLELVSYNAIDTTDFALQLICKSMPTAGSTGDQVTRETTKAADAGQYVTLALKPVVTAAGPTNLKTFNNLAKASVKVINNLAIASIKTFDGLT